MRPEWSGLRLVWLIEDNELRLLDWRDGCANACRSRGFLKGGPSVGAIDLLCL